MMGHGFFGEEMMTLNIASEAAVKDLGIPLVNRILDLWHEEVQKHLGHDIPVLVGNRRKHPGLSAFRGLNTQVTLSILDKKAYLALWYDPYEILYGELLKELGYGDRLMSTMGPLLEAGGDLGTNYEPAANLGKLDWNALSRRMIFWVLRVRGFKKMTNRDNRFKELENLLAAEGWTPPLNTILAELGENLPGSFSDVVEDTLAGMGAMKEEPPRRVDRAINALRLWNLLSGCSSDDAKRISSLTSSSFPRIHEAVEQIAQLAAPLDLNVPGDNLRFMEGFIKKYRLPGDWEPVNEVEVLLKNL